jgi:hypothetical protein
MVNMGDRLLPAHPVNPQRDLGIIKIRNNLRISSGIKYGAVKEKAVRKIINAVGLIAAMGVVLVPFAAWAKMGTGFACGPTSYEFQYGPQYQQQKPLDKEEAQQELQNYLESIGNPNLKLGEVRDKGSSFEADVMAQNDMIVDKFLVDKNTGCMRSEY